MLGTAVRKLVTLPNTTLGIVCDLLEKLADQEWVEATKKFLRKENPWPVLELRDWKVWKTIQLGTHKDASTLLGAMKNEGLKVSDYSKDIMGKPDFTVASEQTNIQLVLVSVAELGYPKGARRDAIYKRAIQFGLSFVPAEVGPQLRRQNKGQSKGEWHLTAMEPITDSDGCLGVFGVEHDHLGGLWLSTNDGSPGRFWDGCVVWVFAL